MTESEWLACSDPSPMLEFLRGKESDRKFLLFACACCRIVWYLLRDERSRKAVEVGELFADAAADKQRYDATFIEAEKCSKSISRSSRKSRGRRPTPKVLSAANAATSLCSPGTHYRITAAICINAILNATGGSAELQLCALLRDCIGNPYRPISINSAWQTPTILSLAQAAYDNRNLPDGTLEDDRLTILADALEEAGCQDADILGHLRSPGPHVRGCWALDLVLGKE